MARPERRDVDYFPFYVKRGKTLNILQSKYGLEGIGFFTNLMRFLSLTPDHHYCIKDELDKLNFFAEIGVQDEEKGIEMIELMVKTEKLDKDLWENYQVIICPVLINSIKDAYDRRNNKIITIEEIRIKYQNTNNNPIESSLIGVNVGVRHTETPEKQENNDNNPQSKVKESKVKESKDISDSNESHDFQENKPDNQKSKKFTPPTQEEVTEYIKQKGYNFDAESFIAFYTSKGWKVGNTPMKDWKAACVTWGKRERSNNHQVRSPPVSSHQQQKKSL
ncbi:MAG: hypothetical protein FWD87_11080 [Spirochaetaceae bacterium]|nr:hypothetical protein [Spirochaetaceae bacterium]